MKTAIQQTILRIHFFALILAIVNAVFKFATVYCLAANIEFMVEMLTVISGFALFFFYRKQPKNTGIYFLIYPVVTCLLIVGFVLRGMFGLLIVSLLLFPLIPDTKEFEQDGVIIYTPFQGFMAMCCPYQVKERKLLFFEKDLGIFASENGSVNYEKMHIEQSDKDYTLRYTTNFDEDSVQMEIIKR